jgi:hypothetical protein
MSVRPKEKNQAFGNCYGRARSNGRACEWLVFHSQALTSAKVCKGEWLAEAALTIDYERSEIRPSLDGADDTVRVLQSCRPSEPANPCLPSHRQAKLVPAPPAGSGPQPSRFAEANG